MLMFCIPTLRQFQNVMTNKINTHTHTRHFKINTFIALLKINNSGTLKEIQYFPSQKKNV